MTDPFKPRDTSGTFATTAANQVKVAAERVENLAGSAMSQGREAAESVEVVAGNVKGAIDKSVKDQPMATLAMVAAFAFVLGAIWKS